MGGGPALYDRDLDAGGELIHHSDRGVQYVSIRYTDRLAETGIEPSVGSVGDSYDNALAETIIGLYKTEVIRQRGPWRGIDAVELTTLEWVDWFNHRRLLEPIGDVLPAEKEDTYYRNLESAMGGLTHNTESPGFSGRFTSPLSLTDRAPVQGKVPPLGKSMAWKSPLRFHTNPWSALSGLLQKLPTRTRPLSCVMDTCVAQEPGTRILRKFPFFRMKPHPNPAGVKYRPSISSALLMPRASVAAAPG